MIPPVGDKILKSKEEANKIDAHVGDRVRLRRKILGMSQSDLSSRIGLTFQQVQKYERGSNRISASKLYDIAGVLKVVPQYFFDGLDDPGRSFEQSSSEQNVQSFLATAEGVELAQDFPRIRGGKLRRRVLELVGSLGEDQDFLRG
jgi:transcriptional regulator with XRE-family HTH domain